MVTKYTPPCCRTNCVCYVRQNRRFKYNTGWRSNRLVLLDSEHKLEILQQLRTTLASLAICCPTTWRRQHGPLP